jgi:hypothetical protein
MSELGQRENGARVKQPSLPIKTFMVCDDDDTLIRLREYLRRAGVATGASRRLQDAWSPMLSADALVLIADDFDAGAVADGLLQLLSRSKRPRVIVVTAAYQLFAALLQAADAHETALVLPAPVSGWALTDALRRQCRSRIRE